MCMTTKFFLTKIRNIHLTNHLEVHHDGFVDANRVDLQTNTLC